MMTLTPPTPRALVLDDDKILLDLIEFELKQTCLVEKYTDLNLALNAFASETFSVVISDLSFPHLSPPQNGLQFLESCANLKPEVPRILISAFEDLAQTENAINKAKLNFFFKKPWKHNELISVVKDAIRSHEIYIENADLRKIALTDALTQVYNYRYFWERLESEFSRAQRFQRHLSVMMFDVDDFKKFNDDEGHQKGDEVLKQVAQILERNRRTMDTVARYGGEEFAVILPEVDEKNAETIATRMQEAVYQATKIRLSCGISCYPCHVNSATEFLKVADMMLLQAKKQGKFKILIAPTNMRIK